MEREHSAKAAEAPRHPPLLILVRHSIPAVSAEVHYRSWPLTTEGERLAARAANFVASYQPELIVTSDELKALQTAEIIASRVAVALEVDSGLGEHDRSGVPWRGDEARRRELRDLFANPTRRVFGNESANEALQRFDSALGRSLSRGLGTVAVVTHGTMMTLYLARLTGRDAGEIWSQLGFPAVAVVDPHTRRICQLTSSFTPDHD